MSNICLLSLAIGVFFFRLPLSQLIVSVCSWREQSGVLAGIFQWHKVVGLQKRAGPKPYSAPASCILPPMFEPPSFHSPGTMCSCVSEDARSLNASTSGDP